MSISQIEAYNPENAWYNLKTRLWDNISARSKQCFDNARKERELIKNVKDAEEYSKRMKAFFLESIGEIPYDNKLPLNARTTGVVKEEGLTIEKIIFESRPNVFVTANLYIPDKRKEPCGAVLFQCGHAGEGKSYPQYQKVVRTIASAGLIVLAMDPIGQGERLSYYEKAVDNLMVEECCAEHQYVGEISVLLGESVARYFIADAMRAVDYLETRPEVDKEKIGATGNSGGGTATCHLIMCDDRIKAAAPGTFVTSKEAILYSGRPQDSEQIWFGSTKFGFDHHEIITCFAPKPLMILAVNSDHFPVEGSEEVFENGKRFYSFYDAEENLKLEIDSSRHSYTLNLAEKAAEFFALTLNGEKAVVDSAMVKALPKEELFATKSGYIKLDYPEAKFVFDENRERYSLINKTPENIKDFLIEKINYDRTASPIRVRELAPPTYENGLIITPYLWFSQAYMPSYALMFSGFEKKPEKIVVCLWDVGTNDIESHMYKIRKICAEGKGALVLDLTAMGKCSPNPLNSVSFPKEKWGSLDTLCKDLLALGDSLCALRLFEINYALNVIKYKFDAVPEIYAEGNCEFYAMLMKNIEPQLETETTDLVPTYDEIINSKYYEDYNFSSVVLPGIARFI